MARTHCTIQGCNNVNYAYGLCSKHHQRTKHSGDPNVLLRQWGTGSTHAERFWSRVDKTESCWLWTGTKGKNGYGSLMMNYKRWYAHRFAWFLTHGVEPKGFLLHSCDTPLCVNPEHLREGTAAENSQDMVARNRTRRGEDRPQSRITESDVVTIRRRVRNGETLKAIGTDFNLAPSTVCQIASGQRWGHVKENA